MSAAALPRGDASIFSIAGDELRQRARDFQLTPELVLLLGPSCSVAAGLLQAQFARSELIALDAGIEPPARRRGNWWPRRQRLHAIRAHAEALPLQTHCVDLTQMLLLLPACTDPARVLQEAGRVMRPGAVLLCASLGPDSLPELATPTGQYPNLPQLGELLLHSGFIEPVMDLEHHQITYASTAALRAELQRLSIDQPLIDARTQVLTYELVVTCAFAPAKNADPAPGGPSRSEYAVPISSLRRRKSRIDDNS